MASETELEKIGVQQPVVEEKKQSIKSDGSDFEQPSPEEFEQIEKRLLRKLDFKVVPILWVLFLVSFIDRGNLANAKIEGMIKELHFHGNNYNMAVMVFTLAYVVFQIPANIIFKKFGPWVLSCEIFLWGIVGICQGFCSGFASIVACRLLMGMLEAGFVPGCAYLIGSYYKRDEYLRRYVIFFSAMMAAGAFNGLLARAIENMDGSAGLSGWRWIFIIEGIITVVVAVPSYWLITPFPEKATFLTPEEKSVMFQRLAADGANVKHDKVKTEMVLDWKVWVGIVCYLGGEETASSVVAFQPTILKDLGWTSASAQVHSIPIYAVSFVLCLICAFWSDHIKFRYPFTMFGVALSTIGWAIELNSQLSAGVRYMGMFFVTSGAYIIMPIVVVWTAINVGKGYKRTVALAMLIGFGNCGAFISSNVFITKESPKYKTGFSTGLALILVAGVFLTILEFGLRLENRKRDRAQANGQVDIPEDSVEDLGEKHPDFRYHL